MDQDALKDLWEDQGKKTTAVYTQLRVENEGLNLIGERIRKDYNKLLLKKIVLAAGPFIAGLMIGYSIAIIWG